MIRRIDLTALGLLVVGGAVWLAFRHNIAKGALGSPQALALVGSVLVLSIGVGLLTWRATHRPLLARGLAALPLLAVFGWSEVLPAVQGDVVARDVSPLAVTAPLVPGAVSPALAPAPTPAATLAPARRAATAMLLGSAPLRGIDHDASGTVQLIRGADGRLIVRFEDFSVERGPDYRLYVLPKAGARSPSGGTSLGDFSATKGALNVTVPDGFDADGPVTVLIWCRAYAVPVANASLP